MKVQIIRSLKEDSKNKSGIGYYADFIEEQMESKDYDVSSICFDFGPGYTLKQIIIDNLVRPIIEIIRGRKDTDVVHAATEHCAFFLPFSKARKIVTFHHVMKRSESNTRLWNAMWRISVLISKIYADEFIAISSLTKEEMMKAFKIPDEKITVAMYPPKFEMCLKNTTKIDAVTFVGSFAGRKNPSKAVRVFKRMLDIPEFEGYRLIMCGIGPELKTIKNLVMELGLGDSVDFINNLSVEELRSHYGRCRFLLNTSSLEGLGLTTLEAQICGTPVLYLEDAKIPPEVMVAAISCYDVDDMVMKALQLIKDEELMGRTIEEGMTYASNFGNGCAEILETIYKRNN